MVEAYSSGDEEEELRQLCSEDGSVEFSDEDETREVSPEHNRNFIDCVKSRKETMCPVEMAIRCDTICHLTNAAALTGKAVDWDPKAEKITNNPEAQKMLSLPYREKWKVW